MRVGIDIDFGDDKNLNVNQSKPDIIGDEHCLASVPRAVALLDAVYINARASLLAHDKNPTHVPAPVAGSVEYWAEIAEEYRRFIIGELSVSEEDLARGDEDKSLDDWLIFLLGQEMGDRKAMVKAATEMRGWLKYLNELLPELQSCRTPEDWRMVLFNAIKGDPKK